jgi:uncharacterized protein involved in exopolysaccharide biosynthesis
VSNNKNEFVPIEHFYRILKYWWIVALFIIIGGAVGYVIHLLQPPVYEATAVFHVTIDFSKVGDIQLSQYDEDLALSVVEQIVYYNNEIHDLIQQEPAFQEAELDFFAWVKNITLERRHAFWRISYKHMDPYVAQALVNRWAELGYEAMSSRQEAGEVASYVVFSPPALAELPQEPAMYGRNQMIVAGSLIGFIIGILFTDWYAYRKDQAQQI